MEQGGSAVMEMNPAMMSEFSDVVEPSLFNEYADTEITLFGITGTLRELKGLCPVDEDKMTPEAIDRFAAQALTMSGVEIPERYTYLKEEKSADRDKDQHEREVQDKQREAGAARQEQAEKPVEIRAGEARAQHDETIREQPKPVAETVPLSPLPAIAENMQRVIIEKSIELPAGNDGAAIGMVAPLEPLPPVRSVETEQVIRVRDLYVEESPTLVPQAAAAAETPLAPAEQLPVLAPVERIRAIMDAVLAEYEPVDAPEEAARLATPEIVGDEVLLPEPTVEMGIVHAENDSIADGAHQSFAAELFDQERKRSVAMAAAEIEIDPELEARQHFVDQHEWTLEIANTEPELVFEDFKESLLGLISLDEKAVVPGGQAEVGESEADLFGAVHTEAQAESVPPVCREVAEKLVALEPAEKEAILPVVKSVAEAVQEVRLLETSKASPEEVGVAKERLKELVIAMFDAIGIEYDDEKVDQFVQSLLRPEFMPAPTQTQELDLEHMGTHEIKRHFPQLVTTLTDFFANHPLRTLGMFALFRENPGIQSDILAVDTWSGSPATGARWYNKANA